MNIFLLKNLLYVAISPADSYEEYLYTEGINIGILLDELNNNIDTDANNISSEDGFNFLVEDNSLLIAD